VPAIVKLVERSHPNVQVAYVPASKAFDFSRPEDRRRQCDALYTPEAVFACR